MSLELGAQDLSSYKSSVNMMDVRLLQLVNIIALRCHISFTLLNLTTWKKIHSSSLLIEFVRNRTDLSNCTPVSDIIAILYKI